jgi:hypothetical protein
MAATEPPITSTAATRNVMAATAHTRRDATTDEITPARLRPRWLLPDDGRTSDLSGSRASAPQTRKPSISTVLRPSGRELAAYIEYRTCRQIVQPGLERSVRSSWTFSGRSSALGIADFACLGGQPTGVDLCAHEPLV